jgi:hypothetical protein
LEDAKKTVDALKAALEILSENEQKLDNAESLTDANA